MLIDSGSTLNILDEKKYNSSDRLPILKQSNTNIFTVLGKNPPGKKPPRL